jgi:hypothetical protein
MMRTGSNKGSPNYLLIRGNPYILDAAKGWLPSYMLGYINNGMFAVYKVDIFGTATVLQGWTASAAIVKGGWNTLKVVAVGSSLKFYINNVLVYSGVDSSLSTGMVGFSMYRDNTSTGNALYVDSASLFTTPTADINPNAPVTAGETVPGGSIEQAP